MTAEYSTLLARRTEFTSGLELEIETFYLFAKIYLHRIAQFLGRYFGNLRGVSTKSHDQLTRNFQAFRDGHGLEVPEGFEQRLIDLKHRIANDRGAQMAYESSEEKGRGLIGQTAEELRLVTTPAQADDRRTHATQAESEELRDLASAIDAYCEAVQVLVSATRARSQSLKAFPRPDWPRSLND